jgi:hypothetical protein
LRPFKFKALTAGNTAQFRHLLIKPGFLSIPISPTAKIHLQQNSEDLNIAPEEEEEPQGLAEKLDTGKFIFMLIDDIKKNPSLRVSRK